MYDNYNRAVAEDNRAAEARQEADLVKEVSAIRMAYNNEVEKLRKSYEKKFEAAVNNYQKK